MRIRSTRHKGLKALIESDDARGLRADQAKRIRNVLRLSYTPRIWMKSLNLDLEDYH